MPPSTTDRARASNTVDPSSLSNPSYTKCTHLDLKAAVDFEKATISGTAVYTVEVLQSTDFICLDSKDISIHSVELNNKKTTFSLHDLPSHNKDVFGQQLRIPLPADVPVKSTVTLAIAYTTSPKASAIQWLPPSQTLGKVRPYMFTQCQAIHCRTLLPCQDSPSTKITYKAEITCAKWATVLMSALSKGKSDVGDDTVHLWEQPIPTSTYLIAFCVGDLKSKDISDRCRVWAEPGIVDAVAYEFGETEDFLKTAESLTLPYAWTRYDVVCLPPSFPYGGMENPCLTFVTPTLLAGDRSLADVVAHEIAHSWTGNLVTNATWEHFWLNEGWTMWLQRKIMARMKKDVKFFDFDAIGGVCHLEDDMKILDEDFQRLIPNITGCDPDDAFSGVPYEKGFSFLLSLERRVGSPAFEDFAKAYLKRFKFLTITSAEFRTFFESYFAPGDQFKDFDWDVWFHEPGMPKEMPLLDRTLSSASEKLAADWVAFDKGDASKVPELDISGWITNQTTCFLDAVITTVEKEGVALKSFTTMKMDETYGFSRTQNSEILFRFCKLAVAAEQSSILPIVLKFITTQGRMKFTRPLYRALFASKMGRGAAIKTFQENKSFYHAICAKMVATDMGLGEDSAGGAGAKSKVSQGMQVAVGVAAIAAIVGFVLMRRR
jgi:leukotriene-A4 hydrolase